MKKVSVREYAEIMGMNERTVRRYIQSGRLPSSKQEINNREITMVLVDDNFFSDQTIYDNETGHDLEDSPDITPTVQEAEIIKEEVSTRIVSMENNIFEQLINSIKAMADDRASADRDAYERLEKQYYELKTEVSGHIEAIKQLNAELMQEKVKAAQYEAEVKIKELKIKELSGEFEELRKQYQDNKGFWGALSTKL